ncbi:uncharacterized protein BO87DRAFT_424159 [Aspergillus neoniger CBS 115656]|uniref:Uncharacterized protein n=1 Tax=Aspergillus neoniger (strain CBS 115656) TaxID=1448310 RepID=A0A318YPF1_ASPNB|nr:hypothetical protein BO87DRAFT_424159 [Aspergillus neoniger CBS 115656]PYH36521.1 hypothetical protein BO87DRAFT_424159 [Aspergillus neoniger CBS 115656]
MSAEHPAVLQDFLPGEGSSSSLVENAAGLRSRFYVRCPFHTPVSGYRGVKIPRHWCLALQFESSSHSQLHRRDRQDVIRSSLKLSIVFWERPEQDGGMFTTFNPEAYAEAAPQSHIQAVTKTVHGLRLYLSPYLVEATEGGGLLMAGYERWLISYTLSTM